jgi:hypothetical protein
MPIVNPSVSEHRQYKGPVDGTAVPSLSTPPLPPHRDESEATHAHAWVHLLVDEGEVPAYCSAGVVMLNQLPELSFSRASVP